MNISNKITQKIQHEIKINPLLFVELKLLHLSTEDLKKEIEKEIKSNPFLKIIDKLGKCEKEENEREESKKESFERRLISPSLEDDFNLICLGMSDLEKLIARFIIESLDENGYLNTSLDEIASGLAKLGIKVQVQKVEEVLNKLQQELDPPGIAARNLKECLLIQLKRSKIKNPLVEKIILNHLEDIAKGRLRKISKSLKVPLPNIYKAIEFIVKNLNPKPGKSIGEDPYYSEYIKPDIKVEKDKDHYILTIVNDNVPKIGINLKYYEEYLEKLKRNNISDEEKEELKRNYEYAKLLIKALHERSKILYKIAHCILEFQKDFLDKGIKYLKVLKLKDVARDVGLHESTISRAISNKYIDTPQGIFKLKFFFVKGLNNISVYTIKEEIKEIIKTENKKKPYTDNQIKGILEKKGIKISRRTIAKYREELNIPSFIVRKLNYFIGLENNLRK